MVDLGKIGSKALDYSKYAVGDAKKLKGCELKAGKTFFQAAKPRTTLRYADNMLRSGVKLNNVEVPADTFLSRFTERQRKVVAGLLGNPDTVVCSAKANTKGSGFSILGFVGKKGNKTVGKGAISVSDFGSKNAVAKWKAFGKNGQTNGFIDCAREVDAQNATLNLANNKGKIGFIANAGDAAQGSIFVTPTIGLNYANELIANGVNMHAPEKIVTNYVDLIKSIIS